MEKVNEENQTSRDLKEIFFNSLNNFISKVYNEEELQIQQTQNIELQKVDELLKQIQKEKEKNRFQNRTPLGIIIPPILQIDYVYALKYSQSIERPKINQIVLIYDNKNLEVYSGMIESIKIPKYKDIKIKNENIQKEQEEKKSLILMGIKLLFKHGMDLNEHKKISTIISEDSFVYNAFAEEIEKILGIPDNGIQLGICTNNGEFIETNSGPLYYNLDSDLLKNHMCIAGITGRGKTIFLKNFIMNLVKQEFDTPIHTIVFDLQGDLVQILKKMPQDLIHEKYKSLYQALNLELHGLEDYVTQDEILFLKPFYLETKGFLKLFPWKNFGLRSYHIQTGEDLANFMPNLTLKARSNLIMLCNSFIECVDFFHFETFYHWIINNKTELKGKYQWILPASKTIIDIPTSTADSMIRELVRFRELNIFDVYDEIDISELLRKKIVFIYFPDKQGYSYFRSIFLLQILNQIYDYKVYGKSFNRKKQGTTLKNEEGNESKKQRYRNLIIIDEAHELLPSRKKSSGTQFNPFFDYIENKFEYISKEGRKYGLWLVVSTQMLSDLNKIVVENAQTRILFELSPDDEKLINANKLLKFYLHQLKQGEAVIYNRDNLKIGSIMEIRTIPPIFLHCDPPDADKYFEEEIKNILSKRGEIQNEINNIPEIELPNLIIENEEDKNKKKNIEKIKIDEFLKSMNISTNVISRVTNIHNQSVLDIDIEIIYKQIKVELRNAGIYGDHFDKIIQDVSIALQSEKVIGIKLLGPPGEGKSQFAFALVNSICIGGTKSFFAVSEGTIEEDLFFGINPRAMVDKEAPEYNLGVICQSLVQKTFPILDEANRAPERIYGGKALTALANGRYIMFPGNQLIQAPPDWKIIFIMNPLDLGTFKLPQALENRLVTIKIPYANDDASKYVLKKVLQEKELEDVIDAFVLLRRKTMEVSPLDESYHYLPKSELKQNADIQLNGISMRIVDRFGPSYRKYLKLLKNKRKAFRRTIEVNCNSIFINDTPEEHEYFNKLVDLVIQKIADEEFMIKEENESKINENIEDSNKNKEKSESDK